MSDEDPSGQPGISSVPGALEAVTRSGNSDTQTKPQAAETNITNVTNLEDDTRGQTGEIALEEIKDVKLDQNHLSLGHSIKNEVEDGVIEDKQLLQARSTNNYSKASYESNQVASKMLKIQNLPWNVMRKNVEELFLYHDPSNDFGRPKIDMFKDKETETFM